MGTDEHGYGLWSFPFSSVLIRGVKHLLEHGHQVAIPILAEVVAVVVQGPAVFQGGALGIIAKPGQGIEALRAAIFMGPIMGGPDQGVPLPIVRKTHPNRDRLPDQLLARRDLGHIDGHFRQWPHQVDRPYAGDAASTGGQAPGEFGLELAGGAGHRLIEIGRRLAIASFIRPVAAKDVAGGAVDNDQGHLGG
jgi:hypothetical protein